jgi:hypothetical protein
MVLNRYLLAQYLEKFLQTSHDHFFQMGALSQELKVIMGEPFVLNAPQLQE